MTELKTNFQKRTSAAEDAALRLLLASSKDAQVFDKMSEGLLILDQEFVIVSHNKAAVKIYGTDELVGKKVTDFIVDGYEQEPSKYKEELISKKYLNDYSGAIYDQTTGEIKYLEVYATALFDNQGNFVGSQDIVNDVSERKRYEESLKKEVIRGRNLLDGLKETNHRLNQFVHFACHDMRAPIQGIHYLAEFILTSENSTLNYEDRINIERIRDRAAYVLDLGEDILEYIRSSPEIIINEEVDLDELLDNIIDELNPPAKINMVRLNKFPTIFVNRELISHIFRNLIDNSIQAIDKSEGLIELGVEENDDYYIFSIADNGCGIAEEYHHSVFKVFEAYGKNSVSKRGIGLAVVKRNVNYYGGEVCLYSDLGKGTSFHFTLLKSKLINNQIDE